MPKENKTTSRRSRRLSTEFDNETSTVTAGHRDTSSVKSVIGSNRYSPFPRESARRDSRTSRENESVPPMEILNSFRSGGLIENGIKYIMFPLHLLRFCIFGTSTVDAAAKERREDAREDRGDQEATAKEEEKKKKKEEEEEEEGRVKKSAGEDSERKAEAESPRSRSRSRSRSSFTERRRAESPAGREARRTEEDKRSSSDSSSDEMVTAEEDSDSSSEQWSSANSTMVMNMSLDCENLDRSMSYTILEEPMDISIDEQAYEKTYTVIRACRGGQRSEGLHSSGRVPSGPSPELDHQDSNSSVDEEIARIFQKQCTSSEDEQPTPSFPKSFAACRAERTRRNNYLSSNRTPNVARSPAPRSKKSSKEDEDEAGKKTTTEYLGNNKRRKVAHEEDPADRRSEDREREERRKGKREEKRGDRREEKRGNRHETPSKHRSRASRNPSRASVRSKESKGRDIIKYKETATQTDSSFSDDDVEMVPVDAKLTDRQFCCKHAARKSQIELYGRDKERELELNYVADNEDTNDGFIRIAHKRMSSCSTSTSSTDLGFDERASMTPDTDIGVGRWQTISPERVSTFRNCLRAPPGFPEVPQNPPLISLGYTNSEKQFAFLSSRENKAAPIVPPAPSPMRHLYYNYPEFMDLPADANHSRILNNILKNNYPR